MDKNEQFDKEVTDRVNSLHTNDELRKSALSFMDKSVGPKYSYNFSWMGRPIIQYPQDIVIMQELLWKIKPDLIIETGVAHGGSLIFYSSMLELIGKGRIIGIDIDIRDHNRSEIEAHPMMKRIELIQGSSIDPSIISQVESKIKPGEKVLVILDSNHTHEHVKHELELYNKFVSAGSYMVVFDTVIEFLPGKFEDRPWDIGDNPYTAVQEFLAKNSEFELDSYYEDKAMITVAPGGFLRKK